LETLVALKEEEEDVGEEADDVEEEEEEEEEGAAKGEEEEEAAEEEEEDKCLSITGTTRRWSDAYMSRLNDTVLGSSWSQHDQATSVKTCASPFNPDTSIEGMSSVPP